jgi:enamine deaminase RidA (YjgF/YER057c/UK114 family)
VREQDFAGGGDVRRQPSADPRRDRRRQTTAQLLDPDRVGAVQHGQRHDLARRLVEVGHEGQGGLAQLRRHQVAELEQPQPRPHAARHALEPTSPEVNARRDSVTAAREAAGMQIPSPSPYAPTIGFSAAIRSGDWIHVAGMTALNADGEIQDDPGEQTREVLRKIEAALQQAGATLKDVVRTRIYLTDAADWEAVGRVHGEVFDRIRPVATMLVVGLLDPRMRVEIEAVAHTT